MFSVIRVCCPPHTTPHTPPADSDIQKIPGAVSPPSAGRPSPSPHTSTGHFPARFPHVLNKCRTAFPWKFHVSSTRKSCCTTIFFTNRSAPPHSGRGLASMAVSEMGFCPDIRSLVPRSFKSRCSSFCRRLSSFLYPLSGSSFSLYRL